MSLVHVHMLGRQARLGEPAERPYAHPYYWVPFQSSTVPTSRCHDPTEATIVMKLLAVGGWGSRIRCQASFGRKMNTKSSTLAFIPEEVGITTTLMLTRSFVVVLIFLSSVFSSPMTCSRQRPRLPGAVQDVA